MAHNACSRGREPPRSESVSPGLAATASRRRWSCACARRCCSCWSCNELPPTAKALAEPSDDSPRSSASNSLCSCRMSSPSVRSCVDSARKDSSSVHYERNNNEVKSKGSRGVRKPGRGVSQRGTPAACTPVSLLRGDAARPMRFAVVSQSPSLLTFPVARPVDVHGEIVVLGPQLRKQTFFGFATTTRFEPARHAGILSNKKNKKKKWNNG